MNIEVRLFATLRQGRSPQQSIELPTGSRLADVPARLNIGQHEVSIRLRNGRAAEWETPLSEGDTISLFPAIGGG
jgi:molybdopterin converting factor small subunit